MRDESIPLIGSDGLGYVATVRTTREKAEEVARQLNEMHTTSTESEAARTLRIEKETAWAEGWNAARIHGASRWENPYREGRVRPLTTGDERIVPLTARDTSEWDARLPEGPDNPWGRLS